MTYGYGRETRTVVTPGGVLPGGLIFEQVQVGDSVQYAVKHPKSEEIQIEPFLKIGEHVAYQPLSPSPWVLPPPPKEYVNAENLWVKVRNFTYEHLDFEDERQYDVYTAWVLHTWVVEKFDSVPYLHFIGPSNSGKTRALDVLALLCYRPLQSPSVSASSIYRALETFKPTFLLDEFELYQRMLETKAEVIGVLNAGYRRGQVVIRTDKVRDGAPILKGFTVFGPKAIASIELLPPTLHGRAITFPMTRAVRKVKRRLDKDEAAELRAMLLKYRFDHVLDPPTTVNPMDLPDGRLIELYAPLVECAPNKEVEDKLLSFAKQQYARNLEEEKASEEAEVYLTLIDMLKDEPAAYVYQQVLRDRLNAEKPKDLQFTKQKLTAILHRLNIESIPDPSRKTRLMVLKVNVDVLERRKLRYVGPGEDEIKEVDELFSRLRKEMPQLIKNFIERNRGS